MNFLFTVLVGWVGNIFLMGLTRWLIMKPLAPIAVLFVDRKDHSIWGVEDATDLGYWNTAIRNGAHNYTVRDEPGKWTTWGSDDDEMELEDGFRWRYNRSESRVYNSFRITWGKARNEGKREFYIGWTMNGTGRMRLTLQFRPF